LGAFTRICIVAVQTVSAGIHARRSFDKTLSIVNLNSEATKESENEYRDWFEGKSFKEATNG